MIKLHIKDVGSKSVFEWPPWSSAQALHPASGEFGIGEGAIVVPIKWSISDQRYEIEDAKSMFKTYVIPPDSLLFLDIEFEWNGVVFNRNAYVEFPREFIKGYSGVIFNEERLIRY